SGCGATPYSIPRMLSMGCCIKWRLMVVIFVFQPCPIHIRIPIFEPESYERVMLALVVYSVAHVSWDVELTLPIPRRYVGLEYIVSICLISYITLLQLLDPSISTFGLRWRTTFAYVIYSCVTSLFFARVSQSIQTKNQPKARQLQEQLRQTGKSYSASSDVFSDNPQDMTVAFELEEHFAKRNVYEKLAMQIYMSIILAMFVISITIRLSVPFDQLDHSPQLAEWWNSVKTHVALFCSDYQAYCYENYKSNILFVVAIAYLLWDIRKLKV
ncbi:hypothetical protein CYMTET_19116, partial [Cymbomonas tetramitiformis]